MKKVTLILGALASFTLSQHVDSVKLDKDEVTIVIPSQKIEETEESEETNESDSKNDTELETDSTGSSDNNGEVTATSSQKEPDKKKFFPAGNPKIVNSSSSVTPAPPSDSLAYLGGFMGAVSESINR